MLVFQMQFLNEHQSRPDQLELALLTLQNMEHRGKHLGSDFCLCMRFLICYFLGQYYHFMSGSKAYGLGILDTTMFKQIFWVNIPVFVFIYSSMYGNGAFSSFYPRASFLQALRKQIVVVGSILVVFHITLLGVCVHCTNQLCTLLLKQVVSNHTIIMIASFYAYLFIRQS